MSSAALFLVLALSQPPVPLQPGADDVKLNLSATAPVQGRVTDATSLPLPGATITLKGSDAFAVSDDRGEFALTAAAGAILVVSVPGFTAREVTAPSAGGASLIVVLQIARVSTNVTVRAAAATPPADARVFITPLDVVRIPGSRADLMRALETLPGVTKVDEGAGLFVRGGDVGETLVLLDGVVVSHPYRNETPTGGFRGAVDVFLTQGASFTTGGFSAQYGNILSGVVDLTVAGRPRARRATVTAGLAGVSLSAAQPVGSSAGFRLAANRTTPRLLFAINSSPREFDQLPGGWDVSGAAYYDSNRLGSFRVMTIVQRDHVGVEIERDAFTGFLHSGTRHELVAGRWERGLPGGWRATGALGADIYANATDAGVLRVDVADTHHSGRIEFMGRAGRWSIRTGGDADVARATIAGDMPQRGGDYAGIAGTSAFHLSDRTGHEGTYADVSARFGPVFPDFGVRVDYFDRGAQWTTDPRAGVRVDLPKGQHLRFAWGQYHQAPAARYFDRERGARTLRPMAATHFIAGYEHGSLAGPVFARVEAYVKRYRQLPLEDPELGYSSDGYGSARGIDLFARRIWPRLTLRAGASLLQASRRWTPADERNRYPLPAGTWSPDFAVPYSWDIVANVPLTRTWSAGAAWQTAAGRPYTPPRGAVRTGDGYAPVWAEINSARLPRYERLDLSITLLRPMGSQTVTVFASLDNALGRRNFFEYAYSADYSARRPVLGPAPRSIYIGCSVIR